MALAVLVDLEPADFAPCCEFAPCFAQTSPLTTKTEVFAVCSEAAEALVTFSQPIRQPAPAIQSATANASVTLIIRNEEKFLI